MACSIMLPCIAHHGSTDTFKTLFSALLLLQPAQSQGHALYSSKYDAAVVSKQTKKVFGGGVPSLSHFASMFCP